MPDKIKIKKKWHQRWWGILIMIVFVIILVYFAAFVYQVIFEIELLTQQHNEQLRQRYLEDLNPNYENLRQTLIETKDDPSIGSDQAKIIIVEFSDFQCPVCRQAYPTLKRIREEFPQNVKIIYRDMPNVASHPMALNAAMAGECADDQQLFWPFHDLIFENQSSLSDTNLKLFAEQIGINMEEFNKCFNEQKYLGEVYNDVEDGFKLNINGTPTFFINGNKLEGSLPYEPLKELILQILQQK